MNEDYSDQIADIFKKHALCIDFKNSTVIRPEKLIPPEAV